MLRSIDSTRFINVSSDSLVNNLSDKIYNRKCIYCMKCKNCKNVKSVKCREQCKDCKKLSGFVKNVPKYMKHVNVILNM